MQTSVFDNFHSQIQKYVVRIHNAETLSPSDLCKLLSSRCLVIKGHMFSLDRDIILGCFFKFLTFVKQS